MAALKDYFFCKDLYLTDSAISYYESLNMSTLGEYTTNDVYNYYNGLKAIFEDVTEYAQADQPNSSTRFSIFTTKEDNTKLIIVFCPTIVFSYNRSLGYGYVFRGNNAYYIYDTINTTLSDRKTFGTSTSAEDFAVLSKYLLGNTDIVYYNQRTLISNDINYLVATNQIGAGAGGWQVPPVGGNYNIKLNGLTPDKIMLNGLEPDKIMLNGVAYK